MKATATRKIRFIGITISLPLGLMPWVKQRKNSAEHAGSLSSYIRSLIIADKSKRP